MTFAARLEFVKSTARQVVVVFSTFHVLGEYVGGVTRVRVSELGSTSYDVC